MQPPIVASAGGNDPRLAALLQARNINGPALAMQQARQQVLQPQALTAPQASGADVRAQILIDQARATGPMYHPLEAVGRVVSAYTGAKLAKQADREQQEKQTAAFKAMGFNDEQVAAYQAGITDPDALRAFGLLPPEPADAGKVVKSITETIPGPDGEPMLVELRMNAAGEVVDRQVLANPKGVTVQTGTNLQDVENKSAAQAAGSQRGREQAAAEGLQPVLYAALASLQDAASGTLGIEDAAAYNAALRRFAFVEAKRRAPGYDVTDDALKQIMAALPGFAELQAARAIGSDPLSAALNAMQSGGQGGTSKPISEMSEEELQAELQRLEGGKR